METDIKTADFITNATKAFETALQETFVKEQGGFGISTFTMLFVAFSVLFISYLSTRSKWDVREHEDKKKEKQQKPKGLDNIHGPKPLPVIGNLLHIKYDVEG